jgi:hypothetical protein
MTRNAAYLEKRSRSSAEPVEAFPADSRRFMIGNLLRHFQLAAVLQISGDAGRPESMIADARLYAGGFRPALDDAIGVLLAGLSVNRPVFPAAVQNR